MNIVHVFPWTSWGTSGGTEFYILELARAQSKVNNVTILYPSLDNIKRKNIRSATLQEISIGHPNPNKKILIDYGFGASDALKYWCEFFIKNPTDIVHLHCYEEYQLPYVRFLKKLGIMIVFTPHIVNFTCTNGYLFNYIKAKDCEGEFCVVSCANCIRVKEKKSLFGFLMLNLSLFLKKHNLNYFIKTIGLFLTLSENYSKILILNGVQERKIKLIKPMYILDGMNEVQRIRGTKIKFIFVGRLSKLKGLHILTQAFYRLTNFNVQLDIYGPKSDLHMENLPTNVFYKGVFDNSEKNIVLREYDALILPSISYEMLPLSIQEAMSIGLYIIGSRVPGIVELLENYYYSAIVERGSIVSLEEAVVNFVIKAPTFSSTGKLDTVDIMANKIEKLYEDIRN